MHILIVGGGRLVYFLARNYLGKGDSVTIVNRDREECVRLAKRLDCTVICAEGSHPRYLEEAGARTADVVVAVTPYDADNLVICQLAGRLFGVPRQVAIVTDPRNEVIFEQLGVSAALSTTSIISTLIEQSVARDQIIEMLPVEEGKVLVTELALQANSPAVGKAVMELPLPADCVIACVTRAGEPLIPRGQTRFESGDRVLLVVLPESREAVFDVLVGKGRG